jgi:uncharacterized protein YydD (DUF2326 family)
MIHRVFSTLTSFKSIEFGPGLNILLSDKTEDSTQRQTRNRAGKTSFVETIHFLLGGKCEKDSIFRNSALISHWFCMTFDLAGSEVTIKRMGGKPSDIHVISGDTARWPHQPSEDGIISNEKWKSVLGNLVFGIPTDEQVWGIWAPKFRQVIAYFARKQTSGGFSSPFKQATQQAEGDSQVAISFLLGLDWTISQQWQLVRDRERMLREIKKASSTADLGQLVGDPAELRTRLAVREQRVGRMRTSVGNFQVVPEYRELETEAATLTKQLGELADGNTIDRSLSGELQAALDIEQLPSYSDLQALYRGAGVELPGVALRRFEELEAFHRSVVENRRSYLAGALEESLRRIRDRESQKETLDRRRQEIMGIIRAGGALDSYVGLQAELTRLEQETEAIRKQLETAEYLQGQQAELGIERQRLVLRLQQDLKEQKKRVDDAIVTFEDVSSRLYEKAGSLVVSETRDGPKFEVRIQGQKSKGVSSMQVFCFDIALMRITVERGINPGYLIHDSHLFDGVDPRQVLTALQVGHEMSSEYSFQHIVALNSDTLLSEKPSDDFSPMDFVNPIRLTDATEDGGLFGIRFD